MDGRGEATNGRTDGVASPDDGGINGHKRPGGAAAATHEKPSGAGRKEPSKRNCVHLQQGTHVKKNIKIFL